MLIVLFLVSHFNFLFVPCGGLSWLSVSFLLHVKYTLSYRILVQLIIEDVVACFVEHSVHVFDRLSDEYNFLSFPLSRPNFPTSTLLRIQTPALSSTSLR